MRGFQATCLVVEESQIVPHEGHEPHALVDLLHAGVLTGEDGAEVDLALAEAIPPAVRGRNRAVV